MIHSKRWKGSISSTQNSGIVLFDPFKKVEQFYYFLINNWNSSISSNGLKSEQFYSFRSTFFETVLLQPRLYYHTGVKYHYVKDRKALTPGDKWRFNVHSVLDRTKKNTYLKLIKKGQNSLGAKFPKSGYNIEGFS